MLSEDDLSASLKSSCLLCVADMCVALGPHLLPLLPSLLPLVLAQLDGRKKSKAKR